MTKYDFFAALEHARDMYGVEMDPNLYETVGMSAWNKIGNKDYKLYRTKLHPECDGEGSWFIEKPCNLDKIVAITLNYESAQETSPIRNYAGFYNHPIELFIEARKTMSDALYLPGKLVKYKELGDRIYFTAPYKEINILYKGIYTDEEGFPYLSWKEVEAIAVFCAYIFHYKHGLMAKDSGELLIAQLLNKDWIRMCREARVPESVSQNEMNEIMDACVRQDVHRFGQTYKPIL